MDASEKKTRATALREKLRDGRIRASNEDGTSASGASEIISGNIEHSDTTPGATFQDARGTAKHLTPTGGTPTGRDKRDRDNGRSPKGESERNRPGTRRAEESHSSPTPDTAAAERSQERTDRPTVGWLEAGEIINEPRVLPIDLKPDATFEYSELSRYKEDYKRTQRNGENVYALISNPNQFITGDEYKQLKTRKESELSTNSPTLNSPHAEKQSFFKGGVLSKQEVEEYYEPLVAALSDGFGYMDKALWAMCPQLDERPIWSNTTDKEDQTLAKMLLKRGQKSASTAAFVRTAVDSADYVMVGMMLAPRIKETVTAMRERPAPKPKKKITLLRRTDTE